VVDSIENQFHAVGNSQLVENPEQVLLDRVLAEAQFAGDVAVAQAFGHESDDLFLARGQKTTAAVIDNAEGRHLADEV